MYTNFYSLKLVLVKIPLKLAGLFLNLYDANYYDVYTTSNLSVTPIVFFHTHTFLQNCFLCWDRWSGDVALLCNSRAGSDQGHESVLV